MIKAYTLMEMTVAMLLAAISITICYSAYGIVSGYFIGFQQKNKQAQDVLMFTHAMERDLQRCNLVLRLEDGVELQCDSVNVNYHFAGKYILRVLGEFKTDTIQLEHTSVLAFFEGSEVNTTDTIDRINLSIVLAQKPIPLQFRKNYSSANLFQ